MKVSILIPCYNERAFLPKLLKKVEEAPLPVGVTKEIILVDDYSTDGTREFLQTVNHQVYFHKKNKGKGAAIKTAIKHAKGDVFLVQDADLEYDPRDYPLLLYPIKENMARVVYGSRRLYKKNTQYSSLSFFLGGLLINAMTTILYGQLITDEPTCYKVFHKDALQGIKIVGNRFEWEPEITAKLLKRKEYILEVPIRYYPRDIHEGKKINWKDGVQAIWTLLKYRVR